MPSFATPAATSFGFNAHQEIRSHSSALYNERLAILFFMLDMRSIELNTYHSVDKIMEVRAIVKQIYKNIRFLLQFNPAARVTMNLETKDPGVYTTDVMMSTIDKMIEYCENEGWTQRRVHILVEELNNIEDVLKSALQFFSYFIRPDFKQKPDVEIAVERYKEIADKRSLDELRALAGKNSKIDFEGLGSSRIELKDEIAYDPAVDGDDSPKLLGASGENDEEVVTIEEAEEDDGEQV